MDQPLPQQMYLLCDDTDKSRLETGSVLVRGPLLRTAVNARVPASAGLAWSSSATGSASPSSAYGVPEVGLCL